ATFGFGQVATVADPHKKRASSGSGLLSIGSRSRMLSTKIVFPPLPQPDWVHNGYTYALPMRISSRSFTSNPMSAKLTVAELNVSSNRQFGCLSVVASARAALASVTAPASFTSGLATGTLAGAGLSLPHSAR